MKDKNQLKVIPARLAFARIRKNLKQEEVANYVLKDGAALSKAMVSMWETGRRKVPSKYVRSLCTLLDVDEEYLLGIDCIHNENEDPKNINEIHAIDLFKYNGRPVYLKFTNYEHMDCWALYDLKSNQFISTTFCVPANDKNVKAYASESAEQATILNTHAYSMPELLNSELFYIEMITPDSIVRTTYNGWYSHNENRSAIINGVGLVLPYEGLGVSYRAYHSMP